MGETNPQKAKMTSSTERCKECGYCVIHCPVGALSFSGVYNKKGYNTVNIDHDKCTRCTICYSVCPDYVYEKVEE